MSTQSGALTHRAAGTGQAARSATRLFNILVFTTIALQRFAIPFGGSQVPIVLPIALVVVLAAVNRGVLQEHPLRLQLYLVSVLWCAAVAALASWRGLDWSPLSLAYLTVTYVPFAFHLRRADADAFRSGLGSFLDLMAVAAWIGLAQMGAQALGWTYRDLFEGIPGGLVMEGFNTSYPIYYGSEIFKSNGLIFLEPSFYSQFLALAMVVHLALRRPGRRLFLYLAALATSVSGTGLILAAAGLVALACSRRDRVLVRLTILVLVAGSALALSPVGDVFAARLDEGSGGTESLRGRLVAPVELTMEMFAGEPAGILIGRGPGSSERLSEEVGLTGNVLPVFPVVPKLAYEYGLVATALFTGFVLACALRGTASVPVTATVLVMYLFLSGSLLQPSNVLLTYAFTALFAGATLTVDEPASAGA